jgi:hypothetical protein
MTATRSIDRRRGRPSRKDELAGARQLLRVRADPWLLADSSWCNAAFVADIADTMFRNRTASRPLALRYVLHDVLLQIAQDFGETLTGRLARLLAETDERQSIIARELGISETWLSKEYMARMAALVLDALQTRDE